MQSKSEAVCCDWLKDVIYPRHSVFVLFPPVVSGTPFISWLVQMKSDEKLKTDKQEAWCNSCISLRHLKGNASHLSKPNINQSLRLKIRQWWSKSSREFRILKKCFTSISSLLLTSSWWKNAHESVYSNHRETIGLMEKFTQKVEIQSSTIWYSHPCGWKVGSTKHFSSAASQANYPVTVGELFLQVYSHYSCNYWNCREDAANNPPLETQKETPAANEERRWHCEVQV